jgi:thiamine biosynthesis lipoprotein
MAEIRIVGTDATRAEAGLDAVEALFRELDRDWRSFGDGELGRVNAALGRGESVILSPRLAQLVRRSQGFRAASDGLFDPRVGALVRLWGFDDMAHATPSGPPDLAAVERLRASSLAAGAIRLEGDSLRADVPVTLDLNGLAEGAALQDAAALLTGLGIGNALIDTGGDLLALGSNGGRAWRLGVRDPRGPGILGTVELAPGEAIASSGDYEHRYGQQGEYHHILDPRTGRPARGARAATVISRDAELADAAATTLLVGGPARFEELCRRMGVEVGLLVADDGTVLATPAMRRRLQPPAGVRAVPVPGS